MSGEACRDSEKKRKPGNVVNGETGISSFGRSVHLRSAIYTPQARPSGL